MIKNNHWYVYIICDKNGICYKGMTDDLERRLYEHKIGKNRTTKKLNDFILVHVEICNSRIEARRLEKFFKSGFGREIIKQLYDIRSKNKAGMVEWYTRRT